jgi:hypothetical protein
VEGADLIERVPLEHLLGGEDPPVGVVAVHRLPELLERDRLRLALGDGEVARAVRLDARELGLREARVARHVGHQAHVVGRALAQHLAAHVGHILADADGDAAAHRRHLLRDLLRGARRRPLVHEVAGHVGEPHLVRTLVDVPHAHRQAHRGLGDGAEGDERHLHPVR